VGEFEAEGDVGGGEDVCWVGVGVLVLREGKNRES
jgi:hypothetical protein